MEAPDIALARLMDRIKPGSGFLLSRASGGGGPDGWEPPCFDHYEDIREWLKASVLSAQMYERYPDGRWTIQLLLKEQEPGTYRYIVL